MNHLGPIRKQKGYTQEKLAKALGVSRAAVSMWETGASQPDNDTLIRLAQLLETSTDALLGISEKRVETKKEALPPEGNSAKISRIMELLKEQPESVQTMVLGMLEAASPEDGESGPK